MNENSCHHLLTLKLFQTCVNFSLLLNTKEDILKNRVNKQLTSRVCSFVFSRRKKFEVHYSLICQFPYFC